MADLSAISALSSLNERDLYYQYLINNNSTSTMLNAITGDNSGNSSGISGISSLLGNTGSAIGDLGSIGNISSFANILKLYMGQQTTEAEGMAKKLSETLEEASKAGEEESISYKSVQELYEYFVGKTSTSMYSNIASSVADVVAPSVTEKTSYTGEGQEFDFDSIESEMEQQINSIFGR